MATERIGQYLKVSCRREAEALPYRQWRIVIRNGAPGREISKGARLLEAFEGGWVKLDAMLFRLEHCKAPPSWCHYTSGDEWCWVPLGKWHSVLLPLADLPA